MRLAAALLFVASTAYAEAKAPQPPPQQAARAAPQPRRAQEPQRPVWERCKGSWKELVGCLESADRTSARIAAANRNARVLRVGGKSGLYLVVEDRKQWRIAAVLRDIWQLVGFAPVELDGRPGYRLAFVSSYSFPHERTREPATLIRTTHVYCGGNEQVVCATAVTACDFVVAGKTIEQFRGTVWLLDNGELQVVGDRARAGRCAPQEHIYPTSGLTANTRS